MAGANIVHAQLCDELKSYIKSQYFGKSPLLWNAIAHQLDREGVLFKRPYIESSPAYKTLPNGIQRSRIPDWMKVYFSKLSESNLGVFPSPFVHQIEALEAAIQGQDLFVSTGTGSGKTECFMWPLMAKLAAEAHDMPDSWENRGVRAIIMYPMNALVSDQVSRLRRLMGDPKGEFASIFRSTCGKSLRRPQFGMYTGRTPYPGPEPQKSQDRILERTLRKMSISDADCDNDFYKKLLQEGKIPAKQNMESFLAGLHNGRHIPSDEDAELITRFEMQQFCPDILITNYSMLEYMLLRPREKKIWEETKTWINHNPSNRLLFVIDEAHMYRGSSGGEVALLIRRLFHKLGINRDQVQFILTTASMPDASDTDRNAVMRFANSLTAADDVRNFCYLTGQREVIEKHSEYDIDFCKFQGVNPADFETSGVEQLAALNSFWNHTPNSPAYFKTNDDAYQWMYHNLVHYRPFYELIRVCRGEAISLKELAALIFPCHDGDAALEAVAVLLAIAPLAKAADGAVLFPARMHMLFKGIHGVYACTNQHCQHSHSDGNLTLGEVFITDGKLTCPHCRSMVYELLNDRRCGALFFKGYILSDDDKLQGDVFLWRYPGQIRDKDMKELHLYIPEDGYKLPPKQGKTPIKPCYMDVKSGFVHFGDDSLDGKPGIRKLYYAKYTAKAVPSIITFPVCPHCRHMLGSSQLTSFSTRGNQSFYNLIKTQFLAQPAVTGKADNPQQFPNQGRKVLLFSDSRQQAARLARDMSDASDISAARQLFVLAISQMENSTTQHSMSALYDYFCLAAEQNHVQIFHDDDRNKFAEDCKIALNSYNRTLKHRREYKPRFSVDNAPSHMQKYLLRLFAGGYNTLYDSATCWIDPTDDSMFDAMERLEELGIEITEEEFLEVFNAWILSICDTATALGHTISDEIREDVRPLFGGYGLQKDWTFPKTIASIMQWDDEIALKWVRTFREVFLDESKINGNKLYVDLSRIRPRFDENHNWHKCTCCTEITPYPLKGRCPSCGNHAIHVMSDAEYDALSFWRKPVEDALGGSSIHVIDTEEHTAQLSHKDQLNDMWSLTESYEMRFQDLVDADQTPVDILSSTTTMEVGIDIGSLVAVGLRNVPPMRENYQQRAGRAGRRGSSLSTIVTFCEDGPHDTVYFNDPVPMFRGDPRRPWIDIESPKLLQRHLALITLQKYLWLSERSMDEISAKEFLDHYLPQFSDYLHKFFVEEGNVLLPRGNKLIHSVFVADLEKALQELKQKRDAHPELYGMDDDSTSGRDKSLLDALYEEGIIPTYSFPKNVVSTYIVDANGRSKYEVDRGLDIAISEYAPGRSIVVNKDTYQIGGLYYPGSEKRHGRTQSPARAFIDDPNYLKPIIKCRKCQWFGIEDESIKVCPFCGEPNLQLSRNMLRPWGFAPRNAEKMPSAQVRDERSYSQLPLYSTLPDSNDMIQLASYQNIRMAARSNQSIIMVNNGPGGKGFSVCKDCGASMPVASEIPFGKILRPYKSKYVRGKCSHQDVVEVDLGYDFITDMLVLEVTVDPEKINVREQYNLWLSRAAQSLAEAIRLAVGKELDIEFGELITGYRLRDNGQSAYIDIYLYDSLSSGAGYAVSVADSIEHILDVTRHLLLNCDCPTACQSCLKHYRNQNIHGILDRFAALELLDWSESNIISKSLTIEEQLEQLYPLEHVLEPYRIKLSSSQNGIIATCGTKTRQIVIYPSMWCQPTDSNTVFVSNAYTKHAKPYAVRKITGAFGF